MHHGIPTAIGGESVSRRWLRNTLFLQIWECSFLQKIRFPAERCGFRGTHCRKPQGIAGGFQGSSIVKRCWAADPGLRNDILDDSKIRKRQFVHKMFVHNFVPLKPPPPNQQIDGFPLEFLLTGPQTELQTLGQNCEQTLQKLRANRIMNKRAFLNSVLTKLGFYEFILCATDRISLRKMPH